VRGISAGAREDEPMNAPARSSTERAPAPARVVRSLRSVSARGGDTLAQHRPLGVAALIAGVWPCVMGLLIFGLPILLAWAFAPGPASSPDGALRLGVHAWLAGNVVPITTPVGAITLLPMGFTLIPMALLALSSRWAARSSQPRDLPDVFLLSGAVSAVYALTAVVVGAVGSNDALGSPPWAMLLGPFAVAIVTTSVTILRTSGLVGRLTAALPDIAVPIARAATAAVLVMVAGGALLAGSALAVQLDEAAALARQLQTGSIGSVLLLVLCLGFVPNAAIWGASFALGPGFALGTGTSVTASASMTEALPVFPLLAALPADGPTPALAALALLLPLVAGIVAGAVLVRHLRLRPTLDLRETTIIDLTAIRSLGDGRLARLRRSLDAHATSPEVLALAGAVAGVIAGIAIAVLAAWSGGSLGDGRLTDVGPSAWRVGVMASVALATVIAVTAWALARRASSRYSR
jgi:hypothetical protein